MEAIKELIQKLFDYINHLLPFVIIFQYQNGIKMRFGKAKNKILKPGFHWKIPFVDVIYAEKCVETTMTLPAQSLMTEDGLEIVVVGMVNYKIDDIYKFICNVWDTNSALSDKSCKVIKEAVSANEFSICVSLEFDQALTERTQKAVKKYGITIIGVSLITITKSVAYRIFTENLFGQVSQQF